MMKAGSCQPTSASGSPSAPGAMKSSNGISRAAGVAPTYTSFSTPIRSLIASTGPRSASSNKRILARESSTMYFTSFAARR